MNQKLRTLFDYQRFERNPNLARVIENVESRYGIGEQNGIRKLSEDELDLVTAAGIGPQEWNNRKGELGENGQ